MISLIVFILSSSGLSWIITRSKLFQSIREFFSKKSINNETNKFYWFISSILSCWGCFGFYSGLFCYPFLYPIDSVMILFGFIGSVSSLIIIDLIIFIEKK